MCGISLVVSVWWLFVCLLCEICVCVEGACCYFYDTIVDNSTLLFSCVFRRSKLYSLADQCQAMHYALLLIQATFDKSVLFAAYFPVKKKKAIWPFVLYRDHLFLSTMQAELCKSNVFFRKFNRSSSLPLFPHASSESATSTLISPHKSRNFDLVGGRFSGSHVHTEEPKTNPLVSV